MSTAPGKVNLSKDSWVSRDIREYLKDNGYKVSKYNVDLLYYYIINGLLDKFLDHPEIYLDEYPFEEYLQRPATRRRRK